MMNSSTGPWPFMSNYSVFFLQQNFNISHNCLVYSLTLGSVQPQVGGVWLANSLHSLPAYYVTNCLLAGLSAEMAAAHISASNILQWLVSYQANPYNEADNGDSFVALLFTLLGLCVLCWMLMLLYVLLPRHKRKPLLTQGAMLAYLTLLTVLLAKVTDIAKQQYYRGSLNMVELESLLSTYKVGITTAVLLLITESAYLQLVFQLRRAWRIPAVCGGVLVVISFVTAIVVATVHSHRDPYEPYELSELYEPSNLLELSDALLVPSKPAWVVNAVLRLVFDIWFAACLALHTYKTRDVAYSRKLVPLALLTWSFVLAHVVLLVLLMTYWRYNWLVYTWLSFIPPFLDMCTLTTSWEWFYSIRDLNLKLELKDMLGRKLSHDGFDKDDVRLPRPEQHTDLASTQTNDAVSLAPTTSRHSDASSALYGGQAAGRTSAPPNTDTNSLHSSPEDEEIYHASASDLWSEPQQGRAPQADLAEHLPPFVPHPGYSRDDYWDDK